MCEAEDPKNPELAELDEDVLMPSGWSNFNLRTHRTQSPRRFPVSWLSRLGFLMMVLFFILSFILSIIILSQVFQNQSQYNLKHEAIQKELSQLSAHLKDDRDLRAKEKFEVSQLIGQLNKTLNLRAKEQNEACQLIEQLNKTLSTLCRPCPYNWELYKDSCYFFSVNQNSWEVAREMCKTDGTDLVIISSSEEQKYLKQKIDFSYRWWVGLSDNVKEGTWHWVDGTTLQQSFWNEGEPNNAGDEDCCELTSNGWNDAPCSKKNHWICEKEAFSCSKS